MITDIQRVDTSGAVPNCYYFYVGQFSVYHIMSYIDNCMYDPYMLLIICINDIMVAY